MAPAIRAAAGTHVGLRRTNNEDSAFAGRRLLLVADGMGGAAFGEVASAMATHSVTYLDDHLSLTGEVMGVGHDLAAAIRFADGRLREAIEQNPALAGMGTTLTALLLHDGHVAVVHVGDSRAYVLREGALVQLTRDDTLVAALVDNGALRPEDVPTHPARHVLVRVLNGGEDGASAWVAVDRAVPGERYLLCSDGLSDCVTHEDIEEALTAHPDVRDAVEALLALALKAGAPDNVTCVVGDVVAEAPEDAGVPQVVGAALQLGERPLNGLARP
jgi:serine/threonine protein phosphatase PrpC